MRTPRLGLELEMFAYDADTLAPLGTDSSRLSPGQLMERVAGLDARFHVKRDGATGVVIGVELDSGNFSLEPGGQVEFATSPQTSLQAVLADLERGLGFLEEAAQGQLLFLDHGTNPSADEHLPLLVPKHRYRILDRYFASQPGGRGQHMMRYSATAQPNVDVPGEEAWQEAVTLTLQLTPYARTLFANSRYFQGHLSGPGSERQRIWAAIDSSRTGIPPADPEQYLLWARAAYVFLAGELPLEEQPRFGELSYADWELHGYKGTRPTPADWENHLGTLFPELRLRRFLEVRMVDAQPYAHALAPMAFWAEALQHAEARRRLRSWLQTAPDPHTLESAQALLALVRDGCRDELARRSLTAYAGWLEIRERSELPPSGLEFVRAHATAHPARQLRSLLS